MIEKETRIVTTLYAILKEKSPKGTFVYLSDMTNKMEPVWGDGNSEYNEPLFFPSKESGQPFADKFGGVLSAIEGELRNGIFHPKKIKK